MAGRVSYPDHLRAVEEGASAPQNMMSEAPIERDELGWSALGQRLRQRGETLLLIEASAGGVVSAAATAAPGASGWFAGAITPYGDALKRDWLRECRPSSRLSWE